MLLEDKIILAEQNPVLLQEALIIDDGYFLSLVLCPAQEPAIPDFTRKERYARVVLYRRKRVFWTLGLLLPLGSFQNQLVQAAGSLIKWWHPVQMAAYIWYRFALIRRERYVSRVSFTGPPDFKLLWENSDNCLALLLNGEPWAFICGEKGVGYSKGLLRSDGSSNAWDQSLFNQIFCKA